MRKFSHAIFFKYNNQRLYYDQIHFLRVRVLKQLSEHIFLFSHFITQQMIRIFFIASNFMFFSSSSSSSARFFYCSPFVNCCYSHPNHISAATLKMWKVNLRGNMKTHMKIVGIHWINWLNCSIPSFLFHSVFLSPFSLLISLSHTAQFLFSV